MPAGEHVLLSRASDEVADMIVMGAYGHSRLRELVLGGVSRALLAHMTMPVLMAHRGRGGSPVGVRA
jgi:nucleotide-binding universal stress UspA family protein